MVEADINAMLEEGEAELLNVSGRPYIYLPEMLAAERYVASRIELMLMLEGEAQADYTEKIEKLEQEKGITYANLQKQAIQGAMNHSLFIDRKSVV